jgi:hypothetical protein
LFLTCTEELIARCKADLASEFEMKDIGLMHYFLGIFLGQGKYAVEILRRLRMEDCKSMATPMVTNMKNIETSDSELLDPKIYRKVIGSLMYLVNNRPDILFIVNTLSQFMVELR